MPNDEDQASKFSKLTAATGLPAHVFYLQKLPVEIRTLVVSFGAVISLMVSRPASTDPAAFLRMALRQLAEAHPMNGDPLADEDGWNGVFFATWLACIELSDQPAPASSAATDGPKAN